MQNSKNKASGQLVGITDYMSAGLEANDYHTNTCTLNIYTMNVTVL